MNRPLSYLVVGGDFSGVIFLDILSIFLYIQLIPERVLITITKGKKG